MRHGFPFLLDVLFTGFLPGLRFLTLALALEQLGPLAIQEVEMQGPDFRQTQKFQKPSHDRVRFFQLGPQRFFFLMALLSVGRVFPFKPRLLLAQRFRFPLQIFHPRLGDVLDGKRLFLFGNESGRFLQDGLVVENGGLRERELLLKNFFRFFGLPLMLFNALFQLFFTLLQFVDSFLETLGHLFRFLNQSVQGLLLLFELPRIQMLFG
ncbi:hypothetical protein [Desulfovibrio sp. ZJ200]|uniref:hypothetical protein n=1 Tax=Desulfovibrio sp. ZJ200 TaxID=2709792 RepID=UPI0013ECECA0|nr:hypothetical protein [Desulfovibrio sp. ZJ200]